MGTGNADSNTVSTYYKEHSSITKASKVEEVFNSRRMNAYLDPQKLKNGIRESCDSLDNPNSRAIAIGFDETGSMGEIPFEFIQKGFPNFINMIQGGVLGYDPHILFAAIGDVKVDEAPFQVTQFEADTRMLDQLSLFYIEGHGGGNDGESYQIPWYFLANHTRIDCFEKRGKKGIYISVGDDKPHPETSMSQIKRVFGQHEAFEASEISTDALRDAALKKWNLYHILVKKNHYYSGDDGYGSDYVEETWHELLGNHTICLGYDKEYIAEAMATILKLQSGMDKYDAINMIEDRKARKVIREAFANFEVYEEDANLSDNKDDKVEFI